MADYDFKTLNDKEFEIFCADLLSDVHGVRFERFKPGRDGGVDGRYFLPSKGEVILQCKHWAGTPNSQLIGELKNKEKPKLDKLRPVRYVITMSNPLSRADKVAIRKVLSPHVLSDDDILGKEDLNDLLRPRPEIERRHYKLWLCSTSVLSHIINKPIFDRSAFSLEEAIDGARKYVTTENHGKAIDRLERHNVLIITGEPGVGKTTLAEHVCLHYVSEGFQFLKIGEAIEEAEAVFEEGLKQIFYFDDFLGQSYLEAMRGHEGSRIVQFIRRVNKGKDKRLILTSRSTILNQGKVLLDSFRHQKIDRNEFELTVASLSEIDKAHILYNHIWHSSLGVDFIEELYESKRYREIINHKNYNPRLINFITDSERIEGIKPDDYWPYISQTLANPAEVWDNPFVAQQDDFGRAIVLLLALNGAMARQGELADAYLRFISMPVNVGLSGRRDFVTNIRHLTGSLINRRIGEGETGADARLELFNPSLRDYVLRRYVSDIPTMSLGFLSLRTDSSINTIRSLVAGEIVEAIVAKDIARLLLKEAVDSDFVGYGAAYIAAALWFLIENGSFSEISKDTLDPSLSFIADEPLPYMHENTALVISRAAEGGLLGPDVVYQKLSEACAIDNSMEMELRALSSLQRFVNSDDLGRELLERFNRMVIDYLSNSIADDVHGNDVLSDVGYEDFEEAKVRVEAVIAKRLGQLGVTASASSVGEVLNYFDYEDALTKLYMDSGPDRDYREAPYSPPFDGIDDLFDRG